MLPRPLVGKLAVASLCILAYLLYSLISLLSEWGEFACLTRLIKNFIRTVKQLVADMPSASMTPVMLEMKRLIACRSRSLCRGSLVKPRITIVVATRLMSGDVGIFGSLCPHGNRHYRGDS